MSFNNKLKEEIKDTPITKACCREAEFAGFTVFEGKTSSNRKYLPYYKPDKSFIKFADIKKNCCLKAFIRGVFLACGSMMDPEQSYHVEFTCENLENSILFEKLLEKFNIRANIIERKSNLIIYIKDGEMIADLLKITGAHKVLMEYENIRIMKNVRNNVNRVVNFDSANLDKTIEASIKHREDILYIKNTIGLEKLPKILMDVALCRLENEEINLSEIGELLDPPISKSGVSHRLKKINKIAEKIKNTTSQK